MAQQSIFHVRQRSSGRLDVVGPMIYKTATTVPPYWHKAIYAMTVSSPSSPTNTAAMSASPAAQFGIINISDTTPEECPST